MASLCISATALTTISAAVNHPSSPSSSSPSPSNLRCCVSFPNSIRQQQQHRKLCLTRVRTSSLRVVSMAPEEEKMTRRSPLDFPIEWERPKPGRRPDIFPQFSPMKTPLPTPMPADPPEEDEDEEEGKEEEEEDPDKEEQDNPEKQ